MKGVSRWKGLSRYEGVVNSERPNRTGSSSSSIEPGSSMRFDGSIELESSIHRTKIEPNPYLNEPFSTNKQQTKKNCQKMNRIVLFFVWENCLLKKVNHILASISSLEIVESRLFDWKCTILLLKSSVRVRFEFDDKSSSSSSVRRNWKVRGSVVH